PDQENSYPDLPENISENDIFKKEDTVEENIPDQEKSHPDLPENISENDIFQTNISQDSASKVSLDDELFKGHIHETLSPKDIFVGDEELYNSLESSSESFPGAGQSQPKRFLVTQKALIAAMVLIAALLTYSLYQIFLAPAAGKIAKEETPAVEKTEDIQETLDTQQIADTQEVSDTQQIADTQEVSDTQQIADTQEVSDTQQIADTQEVSDTQQLLIAQQSSPTEPAYDDIVMEVSQQFPLPQFELDPQQPISLRVAQRLYRDEDYTNAYAVYYKLHENLSESHKEELMRDFLQLEMALCIKENDDFDQAHRLLRMVSRSRSPIIKIVANYHLSLLKMQKRQYLSARTRAYQAIAVIDTSDCDKEWALLIRRHCNFLIAEAVSRDVFLLYDADKDLPDRLWGSLETQKYPFAELDESELKLLLNSGLEKLSKALISPQIYEIEPQADPARYNT
ncbi:unnamed protein product, partial [marine sediment metagenome]